MSPAGITLVERFPGVDDYRRLRLATGLSDKSEAVAQAGLGTLLREAEIREIENGVQELNEIFRDLSHIVQEQGGIVGGGSAVTPVRLVVTGDAAPGSLVTQDLNTVLVEADVLEARRAAWQPRPTDYGSGALWRYAQNVGPAYKGAVTHPGAAAERHVYADI